MRYLLIIFSLFFWSCSEGGNPLSSDQIQIPEMSDICENIFSDVDGSLVSCDESCGLFSENCYHLYDLQVLEDIVFMNDSLDLSLLDVGNQGWTDGRLTTLDLSNLELIALPESICNLNSVISVDNNNLCPPYQFECIDNIGTQNISGCADFTEYSGQSYYDFDINVLTEIKNLNPILSDILLLDIGEQNWYNGRLSSINLSNLELIALPESICTLNAITNVDNNQLCQEFQYECIDQGEWGIQSGLESMDCTGECFGSAVEDVCGVCNGSSTNVDECQYCEYTHTSTTYLNNSGAATYHEFSIPSEITTNACYAWLRVEVSGDYGNGNEYATVYVEGDNLGTVGGDDYDAYYCDCSDHTEYFNIDLASYVGDGVLTIEINNTDNVDVFCTDYYYYGYYGCNAENSHTVELIISDTFECFSDIDADGICDDTDTCPNDPNNDADGDGICGDVDPCPDDPYNDCTFLSCNGQAMNIDYVIGSAPDYNNYATIYSSTTDDYDERDHIYQITVTEPSYLDASTCSSYTAFDTKLYVLDALCNLGYSNDDSNCYYSDLHSTIENLYLPAPGNYYIVVSPYSSSLGNYELNVGLSPSYSLSNSENPFLNEEKPIEIKSK